MNFRSLVWVSVIFVTGILLIPVGTAIMGMHRSGNQFRAPAQAGQGRFFIVATNGPDPRLPSRYVVHIQDSAVMERVIANVGSSNLGPGVPSDSLPSWTRWPHAQLDVPPVEMYAVTVAMGWPWRCIGVEWVLRSERHPTKSWEDIQVESLERGYLVQAFQREFVIPARPLLPGLLGNLAIGSAISCTVAIALGSVVAWRRSRRGCCPICSYRLHGCLSCSECGQ